MKLQILSDLHLEFLGPDELAFIDSLDKASVDVAVVAGDLCGPDFLPHAIKALCEQYPKVVYVTGNHEYYGASPRQVHELLGSLRANLSNLHWLHNSSVDLDGVQFSGTTLWFRDDPDNITYERRLNDFHLIRDFKPWVYQENARALDFLKEQVPLADVVVTHHLPSKQSIQPCFEGDPLNRFFLCDVDDLIERVGPTLWVHGHTHGSIDARVGDTRIVCNPLGYPNWYENSDFDKKLIVEVEPSS
jgi:Icc-related predicted phosphoesterase